jgi:hypothetical protein
MQGYTTVIGMCAHTGLHDCDRNVCSYRVVRLIGMCAYAGLYDFSSNIKQQKQTPWLESARELYRPSDRRLSTKLVPTFADRGVSRSQSDGSPTAVILAFT